MNGPIVSIIIPTLDNQDTIAICLESINQQTYDAIEIIVVDGGSTDFTNEICNKYNVTLLKPELGRSGARVKGARKASGKYLFHVDSDMELTPDVVRECVRISESFDALTVPETNISSSYWGKCTDVGKCISRQRKVGNLRFLPRKLYFDVGGHNPKLTGKEDEELHNLIKAEGASISYTTNLIRHHIGNVSLLDILSQRWLYIQSLSAYNDYSRDTKIDTQHADQKSSLIILLEEFKRRPSHVIGFLFLTVCTIFLSQVSQRAGHIANRNQDI